jgi:hypothetical protein
MSLIQSWILYIGGLGGGDAGGTGCRTATGFSVFLIAEIFNYVIFIYLLSTIVTEYINGKYNGHIMFFLVSRDVTLEILKR